MLSIAGHMHSLPLFIHYIQNGCVAFTRKGDFQTIYDQHEEGISAVISNQDMLVGSLRLAYNTQYSYKNMPELLSWLQQLNLQSPIEIKE